MQVAIRITENDGPPTAMQFAAPSVLLVGRHSDCDLRLEGDLVSRKHARIMLGSTAFIVEDLSANGTEVPPSVTLHGERRELEYGSQLRIGPFSLVIGDAPAPVVGRPAPPPVPRRTAPPAPPSSATSLPTRHGGASPSSRPPPPLPSGSPATAGGFSLQTLASSIPQRFGDPASTDETFDRSVLPHFAPVLALLGDSAVSLVTIDGPALVSVERGGVLQKTDIRFGSTKALIAALRAAAQYAGRTFDEETPILEARLPEGWRFTAVLPPSGRGGPYVTLRRSARERLGVARLCELGSLTEPAAQLLHGLVATGHSVVIGGGAGSGKTSLLDALTAFIPAGERVILLEEHAELDLRREHVVTLEASSRATLQRLFSATVAMRPDRVIVGELRGTEALDVILATTHGQGALLTTVRAGGPRDVLTRLLGMTLTGAPEASPLARRAQIGSAIQVIVHVARLRDGSRKVTHISEVVGFDVDRGAYDVRDLYLRTVSGIAADGRVLSELAPTGVLPARLEELMAHGYDLPHEMHEAAEGLPAGATADRHP